MSDFKLDGNRAIMESDENPNGGKLILEGPVLKAQIEVLELNDPEQRKKDADPNSRRRALVHGSGDKLIINCEGDYPGGVEIVGLEVKDMANLEMLKVDRIYSKDKILYINTNPNTLKYSSAHRAVSIGTGSIEVEAFGDPLRRQNQIVPFGLFNRGRRLTFDIKGFTITDIDVYQVMEPGSGSEISGKWKLESVESSYNIMDKINEIRNEHSNMHSDIDQLNSDIDVSIDRDNIQLYPGTSSVSFNRRKRMSNNIDRLRDIPYEDIVAIMGHRATGADYPSIHPPLKEIGEPDCPIRQLVEPTPSAALGDRIRYSQFIDSMYFAPSTPYWRSYWAAINCRGVDPGTSSGSQIIEARERDIETYTKTLMNTEMFDPALSSMRGCTVHGHSLRLDENRTMFDMLGRTEMGADGNIYALKDQVGIPLDRKIKLGKPMSEAEAKKRSTIFRMEGVPMCGRVGDRKYDEIVEVLYHIWELRSKWGFRPE